MEALLSAPVTSMGIVLGKYLGVLCTYTLIWTPTLLYVVVLRGTGTIHLPAVATSYLGLGLVGASYLALGVLMSAMAKSQLIALLLSTAVLFGIFVLGIGEYVFEPGPLRDLCGHVSLVTLLEETSKGLIDTRRVVLHVTVSAWALFVTSRVVDSWRDA
jgi:ABC-2 type transport system permease protein